MNVIDASVLADMISLAKRQITEDIGMNVVPTDVTSVAALHDHVDANTYGGLDDIDDDIDTVVAYGNAMHDALDRWLAAGRPTD